MKTNPMQHQKKALVAMEGKRNFALLAEQGTGKTWITIADTERAFLANKINALMVIAPNGVHTNWVRREIPTHISVPVLMYVWRGKPTSKKAIAELRNFMEKKFPDGREPLRVFAINVEATNSPGGYNAAEEFVQSFRCIGVVDESTRIKNPNAKRTQKVIALGRFCVARRILTGTPMPKAPTDLYSQYDFLKEGILGTYSYRAFVVQYAVLHDKDSPQMQALMRKVGGKGAHAQLVQEDDAGNPMWRNLDQLRDLIAPHSFRVRKADCLDLPPKVYKAIYFEMTSKQRAVYDKLKEDYHYEHDGDDLSFEAIATRTKLKQVTSGFINIYGEPQLMGPEDNPRMAALKELFDIVDGQIIIWAMFAEEIRQIMEALSDAGISAVAYYGATSREDREQAIDDFQAGKITAFVGHAAAAGIGITLTAAETAVYYSCSHDNELRKQSEDRNHRIGTKGTVTYYDLVAEDSIDEEIIRSLAAKTAVADYVIDSK